MARINESFDSNPIEVIEPLLNKERDAPEDLELPKVRRMRALARFLLTAAQKRKEQLIAEYERHKRELEARRKKRKRRISNARDEVEKALY